MSISSVGSTDWATLLSQYASQKASQSSTTESASSTTSSSNNLSGVTAINSDGDTVQLSDAALSASEMFSNMDTNGDGALSEDEFVSSRPDDVTEEMAATLYSSLDGDSSGSVTESEYETITATATPPPAPPATSTASSSTTYDELDTNEDGVVSAAELAAVTGNTSSSNASASSSSNESETFDTLDTNEDGVVSAEELAAARPEDVSEEMAANLFNSLDTDGSGGLTQAEYAAMNNASGTNA